ncbi:hypothetical protein [Haloparvum sp. AD34]
MKGVKNPEDKPYTVFEPVETVGARPEPDYSSSPDVNVDGSVNSGETNSATKGTEAETDRTSGYLVAIACLGLVIGILLLFVYL